MDIGVLIVRLVVGALFVAHGTQKLFGWFGGYGIKGTGGFLESLGYRHGSLMAAITGLAEAGGGLLLAIGFLTPLGAAAIVGVMLNAIISAKLQQGLIGGYELDVLYATTGAAVAFTGAGRYSIDHLAGLTLGGARFGVAALVLAAVSGVVALATRRPPVPAAPALEQRAA